MHAALCKEAGLDDVVVPYMMRCMHPYLLPEAVSHLQTVDFGEAGPIRCGSCKAYMNPYMQFVDRGRKFRCCFCGTSNVTPADYICNTGADGRRHDAFDRPELCRGSVDFVASREYMVSCIA